jgi:alkylresorcinol/alkylpyrone synthase
VVESKQHPQIISLGFAVPRHKYTQDAIFARLAYPKGYGRLFRESAIDSRYFWIDLDRITGLSFQQQQEEYQQGAKTLSLEAVRNCLDGRRVDNIGSLTYCSCTGFSPGPTIPHFLAQDLCLAPNTYFCNIASMGCEGGYPGLKRALDFTQSTGKPSLVVACELSSCTFFPEGEGSPDLSNDLEVMRANALFGDAASCALVGYDGDWRHPAIIDTETHTNTDFINELGYVWSEGRLRVRLSRKVPELAVKVVEPAVNTLLERNQLTISDINWFVIHSAGKAVIDNIRDALAIPEEKTQLSRRVLRDYGNTSSTSVGISGKLLMSQPIQPRDQVLVISIGPGMTGGCTLLRFGS